MTRRRILAVPFVMTVAAAAGCGKGAEEPKAPSFWNVNRVGPFECTASMSNWNTGCPKGATCNPPPPLRVECPTILAPDDPSVQIHVVDGGCALIDQIGQCDGAGTCTYAPPRPVECPTPIVDRTAVECAPAVTQLGLIALQALSPNEQASPRGAEMAKVAREVSEASCLRTRWSTEAIACITAAANGADESACETAQFTAAQRDEFAAGWAARVVPLLADQP